MAECALLDCRGRITDESDCSGHRCKESRITLDPVTAERDCAGIIRNEEGLRTAIADLSKLAEELRGISKSGGAELLESIELENMTTAGILIATAALERSESRGVHFRSDYPELNDKEWKRNIILQQSDDGIETDIMPCR